MHMLYASLQARGAEDPLALLGRLVHMGRRPQTPSWGGLQGEDWFYAPDLHPVTIQHRRSREPLETLLPTRRQQAEMVEYGYHHGRLRAARAIGRLHGDPQMPRALRTDGKRPSAPPLATMRPCPASAARC